MRVFYTGAVLPLSLLISEQPSSGARRRDLDSVEISDYVLINMYLKPGSSLLSADLSALLDGWVYGGSPSIGSTTAPSSCM
jgi:hypothetical protein